MSTDDNPKIIVDDDWKTRVQTEKEQLRSGIAEQGAQPEPADTSATSKAGTRLPPPTFESLVSMLVTQVLAGLGQIPMGEKQQPVLMLDEAKHVIDLLGMLEERTKGNLSTPEAEMLKNVLHELRMIFVATKSRAK